MIMTLQPLRGGMLILTDEEKNCLATHGHPIPTSLPLNKEQEKYLKKIRRKIKNKVINIHKLIVLFAVTFMTFVIYSLQIAAQESRRRRKEYTDVLETKSVNGSTFRWFNMILLNIKKDKLHVK